MVSLYGFLLDTHATEEARVHQSRKKCVSSVFSLSLPGPSLRQKTIFTSSHLPPTIPDLYTSSLAFYAATQLIQTELEVPAAIAIVGHHDRLEYRVKQQNNI